MPQRNGTQKSNRVAVNSNLLPQKANLLENVVGVLRYPKFGWVGKRVITVIKQGRFTGGTCSRGSDRVGMTQPDPTREILETFLTRSDPIREILNASFTMPYPTRAAGYRELPDSTRGPDHGPTKPLIETGSKSCPRTNPIPSKSPRGTQGCRCWEALYSWFTVSRSSLLWLAA